MDPLLKLRTVLAAFATIVASTACQPVTPYQLRMPLPTGPETPASSNLRNWDAGLARFWEQTSLTCAQARYAIAAEMGERSGRLEKTKKWMLSLGSAAALASTIYSGIAETPNKRVTIPLSALSGGALLTSFQALQTDQVIGQRRSLLGTVRSKQDVAFLALGKMEKALFDAALLDEDDQSAQDQAQKAMIPLEAALLSAIREWSDACRGPA